MHGGALTALPLRSFGGTFYGARRPRNRLNQSESVLQQGAPMRHRYGRHRGVARDCLCSERTSGIIESCLVGSARGSWWSHQTPLPQPMSTHAAAAPTASIVIVSDGCTALVASPAISTKTVRTFSGLSRASCISVAPKGPLSPWSSIHQKAPAPPKTPASTPPKTAVPHATVRGARSRPGAILRFMARNGTKGMRWPMMRCDFPGRVAKPALLRQAQNTSTSAWRSSAALPEREQGCVRRLLSLVQ